MSVVARLTAVLGVDQAQFETGMKRAQKSMKEFQSAVSTGAKLAAASLATVGVALGALTVRQMQNIDATSKLANSLGVNIREFQALSMVAEEAGVEQEALTKAITTSGKALVEAATGSKTAASAFKYLGLNVNDLLKLTPDQQFNAIADALSKVENPTVKTALAMELFGKNGRGVINMLSDFGMKVDEARAFNDKFNISLTSVDAAKVEEANDTFGRLALAVNGLGNTMAVYFSPIITDVSNALLELGVSGETFKRGIEFVMSALTTLIDAVRMGFLGLKMVISDVNLATAKLAVDVYNRFAEMAKSMIAVGGTVGELGEKLKAAISPITNPLVQYAMDAKAGNDALKKEALDFEFTLDKIQKSQQAATIRAYSATSKSGGFQLGGMGDGVDTKVSAATNNLSKLQSSAEKAQDAQLDYNDLLKDSFKDLSQSLLQGGLNADKFKSIALNAISKVVSALVDSNFGGATSGGGGILSSLFGSVSSGIGSFFSGMLPSFAVGTDFVPHDMTANIHKGEMIIPAKEAANMRRGGGGTVVNQTLNIGMGVNAAARQELARMLPDLRKATIQGVSDASLRGAL
jgi:hypothetical protein